MLHKRIVDKSMLGSLLRKELNRSSSNDVERDTQSGFVWAGHGPRSDQRNNSVSGKPFDPFDPFDYAQGKEAQGK
jgi:hypothetical protein